MKVILYMAMSVNGIVANEGGDEDFLSHRHWEIFCDLVAKYKNLIIGRKTYEEVKTWGEEYDLDALSGVTKIVVSASNSLKLSEGYTRASSPEDALKILSDQGIDTALVAGGGTLNSAFMQRRLTSEVILNIEPVFVGKGVPVFRNSEFETRLAFLESKEIGGGIIQLRYRVER